MRSLWPLLCVLSYSAACTKQSSKSDPAPVTEPPAATDSATGATDSPAAGVGAGLQDGVPPVGTPEQPSVEPSAENPAATPTENPSATPTEPPPETPPETPDETPPAKKSFSWSEEQYWTYSKDGTSLKFNTPWDSEEGDSIEKDYKSQPKFVQNCVESAKKNFEDKYKNKEFATSVEKILQAGATDKIILLVNVVDQSKDRDALRRLDRDAYFWNRPQTGKRPYFAVSNFKKGAFVWEIIASKDSCILPAKSDVDRYLAYVQTRLTATRGS